MELTQPLFSLQQPVFSSFSRPPNCKFCILQAFRSSIPLRNSFWQLGFPRIRLPLPPRRTAPTSHHVFATAPNIPEVDPGMPIPGAVTFTRSATQSHLEFRTDLHTLGLRKLSSDLARSLALSMGVLPEKEDVSSTPVAVSVDVSNEGRDLRLDGILRTAMALRCSRCAEPVAERVFAEFSLLLTENPVVEPTQHSIGVVFGDGGSRLPEEGEDGFEVLDLDLDDKLHFPKSQKTIDLSKYIRDTVHLEIPLECLCAISCRGVCTECGVNLNKGACNCEQGKPKKDDRSAAWGPLDQLKKQLEEENQS